MYRNVKILNSNFIDIIVLFKKGVSCYIHKKKRNKKTVVVTKGNLGLEDIKKLKMVIMIRYKRVNW